MYMASQTVLYASGRTDSGHGVLHTVPIYESHALPHVILHWDLAGCDLTVYLMKLSSERGNSFTATAEREIGRDVKKKLCYIAFDYDTEVKSTAESSDKKQTTCSQTETSSLSAPNVSGGAKVLFQLYFSGTQASGIHDTSFRSATWTSARICTLGKTLQFAEKL